MRLVRRILVVLGVAGGPAVVIAIGCNVTNEHLPGLQDELPNIVGVPVAIPTSDAAGVDASCDGSTGDAAATDICQAAAGLVASTSCGPCATCAAMQCMSQELACQTATCDASTCCSAATQCVYVAGNDGTQIANCLSAYPVYATFAECLLTSCAAQCGLPVMPCPYTPLSDAGADG